MNIDFVLPRHPGQRAALVPARSIDTESDADFNPAAFNGRCYIETGEEIMKGRSKSSNNDQQQENR